MLIATFTAPCTYKNYSQAVHKDLPLLGYRFPRTSTSFRRCGGSSSAQTCPAFFSCIICRQWTEPPRARWDCPRYHSSAGYTQPPAGRTAQAGMVVGQPPALQITFCCCSVPTSLSLLLQVFMFLLHFFSSYPSCLFALKLPKVSR